MNLSCFHRPLNKSKSCLSYGSISKYLGENGSGEEGQDDQKAEESPCIDYCFKANVAVRIQLDDDWSDDGDQLTESEDDSRVELTAVLIISLWALLQPVASGNKKLDNKF